jgi:hypothetical protein
MEVRLANISYNTKATILGFEMYYGASRNYQQFILRKSLEEKNS